MNRLTDQQLLAAYAEHQEEPAFAELVRRHLDLVYSAALRMVRDPKLAEDVAQGTFVALARNAPDLVSRPVLSSWLHGTTRNIAANTVRSEVRRRLREQEAAVMNELLSSTDEPSWERIASHLDAALAELSDPDRDAVLLRYFEKRSANEMGEALGVSAEAAQKRVGRAVEKMRAYFVRRGIAVSAGGLVSLISVHAVQTAPAALATGVATCATAAAVGCSSTSTSISAAAATVTTTTKALAMTTLQKTLVTGTIVLLTGTGVYQASQISNLRQQVRSLHQVQAPLSEQVERLRRERDEALAELAAFQQQGKRQADNSAELLRLRGMAGVARRATAEAEQLKAQLARQANQTSPMLGAMSDAMKQAMVRRAEARLARMKAILHLTDDQTAAARKILQEQAEAMGVGMQQAMTGKIDKDELGRVNKNAGNADDRIKQLLDPDQLSAFAAYKKEETEQDASTAANQELLQLQSSLRLTPEQLDGVYTALYQVTIDQLNGGTSQKFQTEADAMEWALEQKAAALQPLLTEAQVAAYRQEQAAQLKLVKDIMEKLQGARAAK